MVRARSQCGVLIMMGRVGGLPSYLTPSGRAFTEPFEPFMNQFLAHLAYSWRINGEEITKRSSRSSDGKPHHCSFDGAFGAFMARFLESL